MVALFPSTISDPVLFGALLALLVRDVGVESQPAARAEQRLDALGLVRRGSHGAPAARSAAGDGHRGRRRVDAVHVQRQAAVSAYRTVFSIAAEAITIQATGVVYALLGGEPAMSGLSALPRAVFGGIAAYFLVNTGLVAGAIALSTGQNAWRVWHDNFLWSGPSVRGGWRRRRRGGRRRGDAAITGWLS